MAYVMMAIPADLVPAVTKFVESHDATHRTINAPVSEVDGFVNGWDQETVSRAYRESADRMRDVLRFLAEHPDEEVSSEQVATAIDARYGWNTVAGMLGAFGRRSTNRYGRQEPMWEYRWDDEGHIRFRMPRAAAGAIQDAADH